MSTIGKGDWVQCIKSDSGGGDEVVAGRTYYCEAVVPWTDPRICRDCDRNQGGLVLSGVTTPGGFWCPCTFKPLGGNSLAQTRKAPQDLVTEWERKMQDA